MDEDAVIAQVNAEWNVTNDIRMKAGVKSASTDRTLDAGQTEYAPNGAPITLATSPSFTKGGFTNETNKGNVPNIWMDIAGMNAYFRDPANASKFTLNTASSFT
jgi:hypothetical protein